MSRLNRRSFIRNTAISVGALTVGATALQGLIARRARAMADGYAHLVAPRGEGGYGPLHPVPSQNTGETMLELPPNFSYTVFGKKGGLMSDGHPTPPAHDGMAAFPMDGMVRLLRNHEINTGKPVEAIGNQSAAYDPTAPGGVTTLIVDPATRELVRDFVSVGGTLHNCAGGPTPWGSWITCEETTMGTDRFFSARWLQYLGGYDKEHGYCFEVPADAEESVAAEPLRGMGRFVHEAIAVDPASGIVYETEDNNPSGFYQYIPDYPGELARGGRLRMLAVKDRTGYDTRNGQTMGTSLPVTWVEIEDPDPAGAGLDQHLVYQEGADKGGAAFDRLEGCWYGNGRIFFTATTGGDERLGQVWEYRPESDDGGVLTLLFESPDASLMAAPDNVCVSPRGGLIVCEDNRNGIQHIRGLTSDGRVFDVARDVAGIAYRGEFAGATFSPDGETLFVNMQRPGLTYAIWGPWREGAV